VVFAAVALNGRIYAIGGSQGFGSSLNTVEVYDPSSNSWRSSNDPPGTAGAPAPMPTARYELAVAAVNGKIYGIGGHGGPNQELNTVEAYDPATNTWSTDVEVVSPKGVVLHIPLAPMPTARSDLAAAAVNGKIYAIGGFGGLLNTVEVYDPATNRWTAAANLPTARYSLAAADANGLIYAVGGTSATATPSNTTEQYSPPVTIYTFIKN